MKKYLRKLVIIGLVGAVVAQATYVDTNAAGLSASLPVAGIARALNEGKSVTGVKADIIKKSVSSGSAVLEVAEVAEDIIAEDYTFTGRNKVSTIKETATTTDPAIITVGAASAATNETISENIVLEESVNLEVVDETVSENEAVMVINDAEEYADEETGDIQSDDATVSGNDSAEVSNEAQNTEDEEFDNLVIAQVNDYVNVRSEPSEESEIVGKLYNKSVGDLLEEAGEWYKIKSGNCTGYVKGEFVVTGEDAKALAKEVGTRMAVVTTTTLYVRQEPSTEAEVIGMVPIDDELTVSEELDGWAKVSVEEGDGYVSTEFVKIYTEFVRAESKEEEEARLAKEEAARKAAQEAARKAQQKEASKNSKKQSGGSGASAPTYAAAGSGTGSSVANFALQFVGNPYVYGGTSLTNGADCSGFVMSVYRNFGVSLPHSSGGDRSVGYDVGGLGNAQPGDIVCYSGHVALYIGNGQIVHASTASTGIKVSNANYRNILAVRRIF